MNGDECLPKQKFFTVLKVSSGEGGGVKNGYALYSCNNGDKMNHPLRFHVFNIFCESVNLEYWQLV